MSIVKTDIAAFRRAVSELAGEAYTSAANLVTTGMVTGDARISGTAEDNYGVIRYTSNIDATDAQDGSESDTAATAADVTAKTENYVKRYKTLTMSKFNLTQALTNFDELAKLSAEFGVASARADEISLTSVLKGIVGYEGALDEGVTAGDNGVTDRANAGTSKGFYFDGGNTALSNAFTATDLLMNAVNAGFGDHEQEFYYVVCSSAFLNRLRVENSTDVNAVTDRNISFTTILGGKFRLVVRDGLSIANPKTGANTLVIVAPGAISMVAGQVINPVALDVNALAGHGAGKQSLVYRWSNILHPKGYSANTTNITGPASNTLLETSSNWTAVAADHNLGILPVFYA